MEHCRTEGWRWPVPCGDKTRASSWFRFVNQRERSYLGIQQKHHDEAAAIDISQDLGVVRVSPQTWISTLLPHNNWWLGFLSEPRTLLGIEALSLQGMPLTAERRALLEDQCDDGLMLDMAGNAFAGPVVGALLISVFVSLPWCDGSDAHLDVALGKLLGTNRPDP